jgi:hypothetical protein
VTGCHGLTDRVKDPDGAIFIDLGDVLAQVDGSGKDPAMDVDCLHWSYFLVDESGGIPERDDVIQVYVTDVRDIKRHFRSILQISFKNVITDGMPAVDCPLLRPLLLILLGILPLQTTICRVSPIGRWSKSRKRTRDVIDVSDFHGETIMQCVGFVKSFFDNYYLSGATSTNWMPTSQ